MTELPVYHVKIQPEWVDFNGHVRDAYYGLAASYAVDALMDHLGLDAPYRERTRCTVYTLEMHIHFLHELKDLDDLEIHAFILDADRKRIHAGLTFHCSRLADPAATADLMLLHVHQGENPAGAPLPEAVIERLNTARMSAVARDAFGPLSRKIELKRS
ncbi:MAG TPA: thioesterase family protein [Steroidobacteraceae bacterium]|nr:thioesterase family protein [Steroidobacteraceae bacterium]